MATLRSKKSVKSRPKYKQERALKCRRKKAKKAAQARKGRNRSKARRQKRGGLR